MKRSASKRAVVVQRFPLRWVTRWASVPRKKQYGVFHRGQNGLVVYEAISWHYTAEEAARRAHEVAATCGVAVEEAA
jgi:hypothetical protein